MITEGAVLLAIFVLFLLITLYIPFLGMAVLFALPLPFIVFTLRYEMKHALVLVLTACLVTIAVSSIMSVITTLTFASSGVLLGGLYKKKRSNVEILLAGTLAYIVNFVAIYIISVQFFEYNFIKEMQNLLDQSIKQAEAFIRQTGAQIEENSLKQLKEMPQLLGYLVPSMLVLASFIMSLFTQLIAIPVLRRLGYQIQSWPPFRSIQLPKSILVYYVIFLAVGFFIHAEKGSYLYTVMLNVNSVFPLLMAVQGFSFISLFINDKGYSKAIPVIVFVFSMFIPILFSLISFLGIIDLGFSLRQKIKEHK